MKCLARRTHEYKLFGKVDKLRVGTDYERAGLIGGEGAAAVRCLLNAWTS